MSVGLILNLLNKINKTILCEPLTSSINLVINMHEFIILFVKKIIFHRHVYNVTLINV